MVFIFEIWEYYIIKQVKNVRLHKYKIFIIMEFEEIYTKKEVLNV